MEKTPFLLIQEALEATLKAQRLLLDQGMGSETVDKVDRSINRLAEAHYHLYKLQR